MTALVVGGSPAAVDAEQLRALAVMLESAAATLEAAKNRVPEHPPVVDAGLSTLFDDVRRASSRGLAEADELVLALRRAALEHERVEAATLWVIESLTSQLVAAAASLAARLGLALAPGLVRAAIVATAVWNLAPEQWRASTLDLAGRVGHAATPLLSNPDVLAMLRSSLAFLDDALLGAAGVPLPIIAAIGDQGLGLTGLESTAAGVTGLAALAGFVGIAPVIVRPVGADVRRGTGRERVVAPSGVADRVARIPGPETPIVIEKFERPDGSVWFEVYIAGTDPDAPLGGHHPWDLTSNVANLAGLPSSSLQAVRAALLEAGATPGSAVVFTGYSQGGAIAAALAESGDWETLGLVTIGAPSGSTPVTGDYPAIVMEHRDDLIPVLAGPRDPTNAVVVVGQGVEIVSPNAPVLAAHEFSRYENTATEVDASGHPAISAAIAALPTAAASGGAPSASTGTRTAYTAERVPPK